MKSIQYAIIGGTGVYDSGVASKRFPVHTEFGEIEVDIAEVQGNSIVFLARHGKQHGIPPHRINYRANLKGMQKLGVKQIFATAAVGSFVGDVGLVTGATRWGLLARVAKRRLTDGPCGVL